MYIYTNIHTRKCMRVCIFQYFFREKFDKFTAVMLY